MDVPNSIQDIQGTTASRDFCLKSPRVSKGEMSRVVLKSCCWDVIPISTFKYHYGKRVFLIVQQCRYLWDKQQQHTTHVVQDSASQIVNTEVMGEMQQWTWCLLHWYMYILNIYINTIIQSYSYLHVKPTLDIVIIACANHSCLLPVFQGLIESLVFFSYTSITSGLTFPQTAV